MLACAAYPFVAYVVLTVVGRHTPTLYDGLLTRLDGALGHAAIVACYRLLRANRLLRLAAVCAYDGSVPLAMLAIAARWRLRPGGDVILPSALLIAAACAPICYLLMPAVGPQYFWPYFPHLPATYTNAAPAFSGEFRNAMPSLHFAVTLLVGAALWELGWVARAAALLFASLTVLATLGFGEHYVVDLVAAIPFAVVIWLVVTRKSACRS